MHFFKTNWFPVLLGMICVVVILAEALPSGKTKTTDDGEANTYDAATNEWTVPDINKLPANEQGDLIRYGRALIANTSFYFGPHGKIAAITNGMDCQNCHVDAGTRSYSNCFSAVASTYPVYRSRSGIVESIAFRINDCLKRSLNGQTIDSLGKEMKAMLAYLNWLGKDVPRYVKPKGANTEELRYLDRAADTAKGRIVFINRCRSCHGENGEGVLKNDGSGFMYPPLWGNRSYNTGAGLYRITRFAGYVKYSMPYGTASYESPELTDEDAWDVAAFVNSQPRPEKSFPEDWPDISKKAIDYPFGPYKDGFSEQQHKYGPFKPIVAMGKTKAK